MRTMIAFVPQWSNVSPDTKLISLAAELRLGGENVCIQDLNVEFYNKILTRKNLRKSLQNAFKQKEKLFEEISSEFIKGKDISSYPLEYRVKLAKYGIIKKFEQKNFNKMHEEIDEITNALDTLKDQEYFYSPQKLLKALSVTDFCLQVASLPFSPASISAFNYINPYFSQDFKKVDFFVNNQDTNMFFKFFKKQVKKMDYDGIGALVIAVKDQSQLVAALTFAKIAKEELKIEVAACGTFWQTIDLKSDENSEYFSYFDYIILGNNPNSLKDFSRYINSEIQIKQVEDLVYMSDSGIVFNEISMQTAYFGSPDLSMIDSSLYFSPEIILSVGLPENENELKKLIDEIEYNKTNFNVCCYNITNTPLCPKLLSCFVNALKERKAKVFFNINAEFDKNFTFDVLEEAHSYGLRMINWDFRNVADTRTALEILNQSDLAGIWNAVLIEFGTEKQTKANALELVELICSNKTLIHSVKQTQKTGHTDKEEVRKVAAESAKLLMEAYENPLWMHLRYKEYIFLYICCYGPQKVANTKLGAYAE